MLAVTIAATGTRQPVIASSVQPASSHAVQGWLPFNNGSNIMYIGDYKLDVSLKNYIPIDAGSSLNSTPPLAYTLDLNELYVIGTANDILAIMVYP